MGMVIQRIIAILSVPYVIVFLLGSINLFLSGKIGEGLICLLVTAIGAIFGFFCFRKPKYGKTDATAPSIHAKSMNRPSGTDITDLTKLCNLHDSGKLTVEEFAELKKKIIRG